MRHRKRGSKLGRSPAHRRALRRNLAAALLKHERIVTTLQKAKETRSFIEKIVTLARKALEFKATGDPADRARYLHYYRLALARLQDKEMVQKLFGEGKWRTGGSLAERFRDRPGGYTRIIRLSGSRLGVGTLARAGEIPKITFVVEGKERKVALIGNRLGDNAARVIFELLGTAEQEAEMLAPAPKAEGAAPEAEAVAAPAEGQSDAPEAPAE